MQFIVSRRLFPSSKNPRFQNYAMCKKRPCENEFYLPPPLPLKKRKKQTNKQKLVKHCFRFLLGRLLYPEVIHRVLSVTWVSWKFLGPKCLMGNVKMANRIFTLGLVLKRGKIQIGAGVIRLADISVILTIGYINNACWAVCLSRCQCIWMKSFLLVPHFWV